MSGSYGYSNEEDLSTPRLRPTTAGGGGVKRPSSRSGKYSDAKSRPGSTTSGILFIGPRTNAGETNIKVDT